ncbi:zinc finger, CCHC-type containing protein [Tanacetum coccineum]
MKFLLNAFKVYYVLKGPPIGMMNEEEQRKREQDETLCRGYILRKNNKGNDKKRKGTWNSSKDNKKDKKPLSEVVCYKCELHMASVTTTTTITDDWWYDFGASTHVCNNKDLFKTYKKAEDGHEVMMGDNHTSKVIGSGNMEIQFTFGKKSTLMNVLLVPNIRKNIVSSFKLCKSRVNDVIDLDKVILSKANVFVEKAYACDLGLKMRFAIQCAKGLKGHCVMRLIHQRTTPYTPQQNGVAERKNKVLQDMINDMLVSANLPTNLWGEALLTACHRNIEESSSAPRSSERARKKRNLDPDFIDSQAIIFLVKGDNENNVINKILVLLNVDDAPKTYKEVITSRNSAFWKEAIHDEMDSLISNNT